MLEADAEALLAAHPPGLCVRFRRHARARHASTDWGSVFERCCRAAFEGVERGRRAALTYVVRVRSHRSKIAIDREPEVDVPGAGAKKVRECIAALVRRAAQTTKAPVLPAETHIRCEARPDDCDANDPLCGL